jgi:hypothetical protein
MPTGSWFNGTAEDGSVAWDDPETTPAPTPTPTPTPIVTAGVPIIFRVDEVSTVKFKTVTPINGEGSWF